MVQTLLLAALALRIVHFPGGEAVIRNAGTLQRVTMKDARGSVTADSYCDASSGTYDRIVAFATALRTAVTGNDRTRVAQLMHYPLRVNVERSGMPVAKSITGARLLLRDYDAVFTASVTSQIANMEPHDVFCRDGMAMLNGGVVWAGADRSGTVKGSVVNR